MDILYFTFRKTHNRFKFLLIYKLQTKTADCNFFMIRPIVRLGPKSKQCNGNSKFS